MSDKIVVEKTVTVAIATPGEQGLQGPAGSDGVDGTNGVDGVGIVAGGTLGEILRKASGTDYDTEWAEANDHAHTLADISDAGSAAASDSTDFAPVSHTHSASEIVSGTLANTRISEGSVTQHESALTITESQISDLQTYSLPGHAHAATDITSGELSDDRLSSNVGMLDANQLWTGTNGFGSITITSLTGAHSITSLADGTNQGVTMPDVAGSMMILTDSVPADGEVAIFVSDGFITRELTESDISDLGSYASASHTHTLSDITDAGTAAGSDTGDFAAESHNHAASEIVSGTMADARIPETNVTQHEAALSITESQISDLQTYTLTGHVHATSDLTSGTLGTARGGTGFSSLPATSNFTFGANYATAMQGIDSVLGTNLAKAIKMGELRANVSGGGGVIQPSTAKTYIETACTLKGASLICDQSGDLEVVLKRDRSSTITTLATITLTASEGTRITDISSWPADDLAAGDILIAEWGGVITSITSASLTLEREVA